MKECHNDDSRMRLSPSSQHKAGLGRFWVGEVQERAQVLGGVSADV